MDALTTTDRKILAHLGGKRFLAMTGASNLLGGVGFLQFSLPASLTKGRANKMRVTLKHDLYSLELYRVTNYGLDVQRVDNVHGLFAEELQRAFTEMTGLDTNL